MSTAISQEAIWGATLPLEAIRRISCACNDVYRCVRQQPARGCEVGNAGRPRASFEV